MPAAFAVFICDTALGATPALPIADRRPVYDLCDRSVSIRKKNDALTQNPLSAELDLLSLMDGGQAHEMREP